MYILKRRNVERRVDTQEAADKLKAQGFTLLEQEAVEPELPADQGQQDGQPPAMADPPTAGKPPKTGKQSKNSGQEGAGSNDQPGADQQDGAGAAGQPGA